MKEIPWITNEDLQEDLEVIKQNNKILNDLVRLSRYDLRNHKKITFSKANTQDRKVLAEVLFFDCLDEITTSINYANAALTQNHFSVSFSLVRKPFRDLLGCIEYLTFAPDIYVQGMIDNDLSIIDVSNKNVKKETKERIKEIKIQYSEFLPGINSEAVEVLYHQRYSPTKDSHTMSTILNQSLHLVTANPAYRTPKNKLNMLPNLIKAEDANALRFSYLTFMPYFYSYLNNLVGFNTFKNFEKEPHGIYKETFKLYEFTDRYHDLLEKYLDI